eukprot:CAMPEP_0205806000 /NCGR_PEP_ID=MMETSP0205-20121125/9365_1 /ASSEMBLY_ACC=CAM_ASM_000278 /TAXON_ID=36767 /ORGANISM="Euplotes focardii, Strain TN1" /LENGTH=62 /DNA_ID=CAMNT_0053078063 /DNA_START=35 /DNA_END=223 /DNA_ORIENTATION=-
MALEYGEKFYDDDYEYRYIIFPGYMTHIIRGLQVEGRLLHEEEWTNLGLVQSRGWEHIDYHF